MRRRENIVLVFLILLFATLFISFFNNSGFFLSLRGIFDKTLNPIHAFTLSAAKSPSKTFENNDLKKFQDENNSLLSQKAEIDRLRLDNKALNDQFQLAFPSAQNLLPCEIVGMPSFIPGFTAPDEIILDKGQKEGLRKGLAVVVKNQLVGQVGDISIHRSNVILVSNKNFSFTAKTSETGAIGVVRGSGDGEMILDNVLLSDNLKIGDLVASKGDQNQQGLGIPPDLIAGKIVSVDKKASALFQSAKVKPLTDITKLSIVFVNMP